MPDLALFLLVVAAILVLFVGLVQDDAQGALAIAVASVTILGCILRLVESFPLDSL